MLETAISNRSLRESYLEINYLLWGVKNGFEAIYGNEDFCSISVIDWFFKDYLL